MVPHALLSLATGSVESTAAGMLRRWFKIAVIAIGATAGSCGAYWGAIQYHGNFHTVKEGEFYRSAQLTKTELHGVIQDHGIHSILNLRGGHPGQTWYDDEIAEAQALGVAHYDYGLSAYRIVSPKQIE